MKISTRLTGTSLPAMPIFVVEVLFLLSESIETAFLDVVRFN